MKCIAIPPAHACCGTLTTCPLSGGTFSGCTEHLFAKFRYWQGRSTAAQTIHFIIKRLIEELSWFARIPCIWCCSYRYLDFAAASAHVCDSPQNHNKQLCNAAKNQTPAELTGRFGTLLCVVVACLVACVLVVRVLCWGECVCGRTNR